MKKPIIITLAAVGIIAGYFLLRPTDEVKESVPDVSDQVNNTEESVADVSSPSKATTEPTAEELTALLNEKRAYMSSLSGKLANDIPQDFTPQLFPGLLKRLAILRAAASHHKHTRENIIPEITPDNWREVMSEFDQIPFGSREDKRLRKPRLQVIEHIGEYIGKEAMLYFYEQQKPDEAAACMKGWAKRDHQEAAAWLNTQKPSASLNHSVSAFAKTLIPVEPESAMEWAETIADDTLRKGTTEYINNQWMRKDPKSWHYWMNQNARPSLPK